MPRWQDIRQLASLIEAEAEGRPVDRDLAVTLARRLAERHPHIQASMGLVVRRMAGETRASTRD
ncbi:MAG TPA: hypothetical protein VK196_19140 [Magnetospirillum sp.]|nr:hypothetical protein [Magnetospirillum sp.]